MRVALVAAVVLLVGCSGHRAASGCTLALAPTPVPETGEHSLAVRSSCVLPAHPKVSLDGIPFTYVFEGGPRGAHTLLFDKYRCDVRYRRIARSVTVGGRSLHMTSSLMDWCPAEAISTIVHVYRGGLRRVPVQWRDVLRHPGRVWPCGDLRTALTHLPPSFPMYTTLPDRLARATAAACDVQITALREGAPRLVFDEALGRPDTAGPRCSVWSWRPFGGSVDGARACFTRGRATTVQTAVHG